MNDKQIIENNASIAIFQGYNEEYVNGERYFTLDDNLVFLSEEQLEYYKSWNWLMSVVEKIEDLVLKTKISESLVFSVNITNDVCTIMCSNENSEHSWAEVEEVASTKIQAVYRAVIKFIKWYNTLEL